MTDINGTVLAPGDYIVFSYRYNIDLTYARIASDGKRLVQARNKKTWSPHYTVSALKVSRDSIPKKFLDILDAIL